MNKIDFAGIILAENCNPNGDPIQGNMPRQDMEGYGFITDVCLKRKIRDRLEDSGEKIIISKNIKEGIYSVKDNINKDEQLTELIKEKNETQFIKKACEKWIDVRAFGQVFAFKDKNKNMSTSVRGPVTIGMANSLEPVNIIDIQITKSINNKTDEKDPFTKDNTTMAMKYIIDKGVYVFYGSISPQLAEKTGFKNEDSEKIKNALIHIFDNDASSARPAGSMSLEKLYWWTHKNKIGQYSSAKVHKSLCINSLKEKPYFKANLESLPDLKCEVINSW